MWILIGCSTAGGVSDPPARPDGPSVTPPPAIDVPTGPGPAAACFAGLGAPSGAKPDYDQFQPLVGSHCAGTNHQAISGVEKVVFLGDSITEGHAADAPVGLLPGTPRDEAALAVRQQPRGRGVLGLGGRASMTSCSRRTARSSSASGMSRRSARSS
jgi:hypothetical protein